MTFARRAAFAALLTSAVVAGSGCNDKCSTEPPAVNAVASCSAHPGQAVSLPVRLCPTCNQAGAACDVVVDEANGFIQLDTRVEACEDPNSCGGSQTCDVQPFTCNFTAPSQEGSYQVIIVDGRTNSPFPAPDFVVTSGSISCGLPAIVR